MAHVTYHIVEHDGGWAYKLDDVFSEPYPTHDMALQAAQQAASEQRVGDEVTTMIRYQDADGNWREEVSRGGDRPETDVEDDAGRVSGQNRRPPFGTTRSQVARTIAPSASGKPSVSTSDMNGPIWRGGKLTTAMT